jgi:hypothetical protein
MRAVNLIKERITRCAHKVIEIIFLHYESSVRISKEDAEVLLKRLKKSPVRANSQQVKDGEERKIVNFKNRCAAKKTIKDLPLLMLMGTPKDHWFETENQVDGGRIKRSSNSFFRLQAFVASLVPDEAEEVETQMQSEHV